jgi:uncharacterized protein
VDDTEIRKYLLEAIESLKKMQPIKILLFGSAATMDLHKDSDIDFLIVLDNSDIPETYEDKLALKLEVRECLRNLNKKIPIDIIVYTIPEYEELKKINSSFYREIHNSGKVVYEKAS